ncbi:hypothetical protein L1887_17077 [Cichorium endivia]|nr:hypothetical protein L1887_17077 [Cichorium endivia]
MKRSELVVDTMPEALRQSRMKLGYILCTTQEASVVPPYVAFTIRPNPGFWEANDENALELDFKLPTMSLFPSIGHGVDFASKSSRLSNRSRLLNITKSIFLHCGSRLLRIKQLDSFSRYQN